MTQPQTPGPSPHLPYRGRWGSAAGEASGRIPFHISLALLGPAPPSPLGLTGLPRSSEARCSCSAVGTFRRKACRVGGGHSQPYAPERSPAAPGIEPGPQPALRRTCRTVAGCWALCTWKEVGKKQAQEETPCQWHCPGVPVPTPQTPRWEFQ